jgi:hypothetical protein
MPIRVREKTLSPTVVADPNQPSAEWEFYVYDIEPGQTVNDVIDRVLALVPPFVTIKVPNTDGLFPTTIPFTLWKKGIVNQRFISDTQAEATVIYRPLAAATAPSAGGRQPRHDPGTQDTEEIIGPEFSFDTQGGMRHITQSVLTQFRKQLNPDGTVSDAPNLQSLIGLSKDRIEGCDIYSSDLKFTCTYKHCKFTFTYLRNLVKLTATVNSVNFLTFAPGEVLFLGAVGHYTDADGWVIQYFFSIRANEPREAYGASAGGGTAGTGVKLIPPGETAAGIYADEKLGHDYVWFSYKESEVSGFAVSKPVAAYIEKVYKDDKDMLTGQTLRYLWSAI